MKFEVIKIERERAVRRAADQLADLLGQRGPAVGGEAHDLVFVLVHREAEIGGEGRIQHAERMRKPDFAQALIVVGPFARRSPCADRQRRPLADAVGGQDRRAARRRGEERGGGVRLMVLGEQDLASGHAEMRRDDPAHPDLFAERVLHRVRKRPPGAVGTRAART